jgi:hypothetical protein
MSKTQQAHAVLAARINKSVTLALRSLAITDTQPLRGSVLAYAWARSKAKLPVTGQLIFEAIAQQPRVSYIKSLTTAFK